jgi:hypothetical protein
LKTICRRIIQSQQRDQLLGLYQNILQRQEVPAKDTKEEIELRLSGLVVKKDSKFLRVYNRIYQSVFNRQWVEKYLPSKNQGSLEYELIQNHLRDCLQRESPMQLIERFRMLFIDGDGYPNREIVTVLNRIIASNLAEQEFLNNLNAYCYLLINHWLKHPQYQSAIPRLVALFKNTDSRGGQSSSIRSLRRLVQLFTKSEKYVALEHLARVFEPDLPKPEVERSLGKYIKRYPYLYTHCLLTQGSSAEHQKIIRQLQSQQQQQFERNLLRYSTYLARRVQIESQPSRDQGTQIVQPIPNPTLLSDRDLWVALTHYVGKVEGSHTYKDLAERFLTRTCTALSYRDFKKDLYDYLIAAIKPEYGRHQFNQRLAKLLVNTRPDCDSQPVNKYLLVQTCRQLFNFLVASPEQSEHFLFIDLISNNGSLNTVGLLLKIALLARQEIKPHLEHRFSILFDHYESHAINNQDILWLVESLENLNIALGVNFGAVDLSFINKLPSIF